MSFLISNALAATPAAAQNGSVGSILMLLGFVFIFYLLIWLPQSRKVKEHRQLISSLAKGDEIITSGGLVGKINKITDNFINLEVSDNVEVCIQKTAVSASIPKGTLKSVS